MQVAERCDHEKGRGEAAPFALLDALA